MPTAMIAPHPTLSPNEIFAPHSFRWTRQDYYRLGELGFFHGKRVELIRGEIVEMSPRYWPHVVACRKTAEALERAFLGLGWVSRQEPINLDDSEPEPDVAVILGRFEDYRNHPTSAALIAEIAYSSLDYDTSTKTDLYAEKAIPEYWVIDLIGSRLLVFRDPRSVGQDRVTYQQKLVFVPGQTVSPLHASHVSVKVEDLLP